MVKMYLFIVVYLLDEGILAHQAGSEKFQIMETEKLVRYIE